MAETDDGFSGLLIYMPRDTFTEKALENLTRLAEIKGSLIGHAFGIELPKLVITKDMVDFPWFPETTDPDEVNAYTQFVDKLCEMARTQKRVVAEAVETDNEKYAFRCFLLRLGFIGSEYKRTRNILLRNLTGNSAFRHGVKKQNNRR